MGWVSSLFRSVDPREPEAAAKQPIRDVILSIEGLEQLAKEHARLHVTTPRRFRAQPLLKQLQEGYRILRTAHRVLAETARLRKQVTPSTEWLLENFHIIQDQVRDIRRHLPPRYYRELPRLATEPHQGYPRVYAIAFELVSHTDSTIDEPRLQRFVTAYQTEATLSSGELWALPIILRVCLVENLRRLATQVAKAQRQREEAQQWAERLLAVAAEGAKDLSGMLEESATEREALEPAFAVQLMQWLRDQGPPSIPIVNWLEEQLARQGATYDNLIRQVHQTEAVNLVSIGNCIKSLRFLSGLDWSEFFESTSRLEGVLREDPAGIYSQMDFATRDRYRHAVEALSKKSDIVEAHVARHALQCAREARTAGALPARRQHLGYYLIGKGRPELENRLGLRQRVFAAPLRWIGCHPTPLFLIAIALATAAIVGTVLHVARPVVGGFSVTTTALLVALTLIPASDIAIHALRWLCTRLFHPRLLPKLELKDGIPAEYRTMVVVPTILTDKPGVHRQVGQLEVHYLANQEKHLHFALLSDFADAQSKEMPSDQGLLELALREIEALNTQYRNGDEDVFYLFHRERQWNPGEGKWMGWERKRGKLEEFNRLLRGDDKTSFVVRIGAPSVLPKVRFLITLDADTQLPREAAKRLIGTLAHPLNRPILNESATRVVEGYGILQPRVAVTPTGASHSFFAMTFAGHTGVDPYPTAVSDMYQDIFGESIYMGKGIYDVDAFRTVLDGRIPENTVLSHDLLEGSYARAGLVSDVELVDSFPAHYSAFASRMQRWVRGDWQLLRWLRPTLRTPSGEKLRNCITALAKWKMVDNLRRSLVAPALMLLLALGLCVLPGRLLLWLGFALLTLAFPIVTHLAEALVTTAQGVRIGGRFGWFLSDLQTILWQILLSLVFLPQQALLVLDAILRVLGRMFITRRHLLEWVTSADIERQLGSSVSSFFRHMWMAEALVVVLLGVFIIAKPQCLLFAFPLLALWAASPWVAFSVSQRRRPPLPPLPEEDKKELRAVGEKTWLFFQDLVTPAEHHLPPDNYQESLEDPVNVSAAKIAHRTSPTNIGLYLLSVLAARDMGFITLAEMIRRLEQTLSTLEKLPRHAGHFYNWYDTRTLVPLQPLYVSTVDSGNLVGALLALMAGLAERVAQPVSTLKLELAAEGQTERLAEDSEEVEGFIQRCGGLAPRIESLITGTDFKPLYDPKRQLFFIGYNASAGQTDASYYDLLASEARLASFVAIAKGDVPVKHWFRLGRQLTRAGRYKALVSWGGTMFEYLMPLLLMRNYYNTLMDETCTAVVKRQQEYARRRGIPWGVSESGFYAFSRQLEYQYRSFGVPGLGLKRGLSEDDVIAPYASFLALAVDPPAAMENLRALRQEGMESRYGLYDAIDYTPSRVAPGERCSIVRTFMAHHQGMILLALDNALNGDVMQRRFHSDVRVRATALLLQERIPRRVELREEAPLEESAFRVAPPVQMPIVRRFQAPITGGPEAHLLSNNTYSVMLTARGGGFSQCQGLAITRWREDPTLDPWGMFFYIRDVQTGEVWSPTLRPPIHGREGAPLTPDHYEAAFYPDRAEYIRRDGDLECRMEVVVSVEHNAELRRISLTNKGGEDRLLDVTSYLEIALASPAADLAHPAFHKLFVQTEKVEGRNALLCTRRPRTTDEKRCYLAHVLAVEGNASGAVQFETDRARFIGRGRSVSNPQAMERKQRLSKTTGAVLDPILSLRQRVRLAANATVRLTFTTGIVDTRNAARQLVDLYHDPAAADRARVLAWTHSQVELRYLNLTSDKANLIQRLASRILYQHPTLRAKAEFIERNRRGFASLWGLGISGDFPLLLVRIARAEELDILRDALSAHEYLRLNRLPMDLVILNEEITAYMQALRDKIHEIIRRSHAHGLEDRPGGVFLRQADQLSEEGKLLLHAVARLTLVGSLGSLEKQLDRKMLETPLPRMFRTRRAEERLPAPKGQHGPLAFFNEMGGFTPDGHEYIIHLDPGVATPLPWVNVISNPRFGSIVTEAGAGYTWAESSRENMLTPWTNDPLVDLPGEILYLRNEDTGEFWTPTPQPIREPEPYTIRHGQGYSVFEHVSHGVRQEWMVFVPMDCPLKVSRLRVHNNSPRRRNLSATYYVGWTLGANRETCQQFTVTDVDLKSGVLTARNVFRPGFASRIAFLDVVGVPTRTFTCDRAEFFGHNGTHAAPAALGRTDLSGRKGPGYDPCGAVQVKFSLAPNESKDLLFVLGEAGSIEEARALAYRFRTPNQSDQALQAVWRHWNQVLDVLQVKTPESSLNIMVNRWLVYQALSCRLWGRSGFYQCGGAYGFRDQLQDVRALFYAAPNLAREHILRATAHQYTEGDVQHWWHEPTGLGIRSRCSDDYLWLPFVTADYVSVTADTHILDETAPYLQDKPLEPEETERCNVPAVSELRETLYQHCRKALDRALSQLSERGLPRIGSGDWNDGMNLVGPKGKGESVWLGWFLHATLIRFADLCDTRGDSAYATNYRQAALNLARAIETHAWDGQWYVRAFTDNGAPIGSARSEECKIDSLAQSWSVISGAGAPQRAAQAMAALEQHLVRREDGLILLLTPPFDRSQINPGYIKGYVPGVRENGGQYTHAALWAAMAFARQGEGDKAVELLNLINPINHTRTLPDVQKYKVEPYVVAADIYGMAPHVGRGGWTWYTGSAAWMYRVVVEDILGLKVRGATLVLAPCIPKAWPGYALTYRYKNTTYEITVGNPRGVNQGVEQIELDAQVLSEKQVPLLDDRRVHRVRVVLGPSAAPAKPHHAESASVPVAATHISGCE